MSDEIKIMAEPQVSANTCKFSLDRDILSGPSVKIDSAQKAHGSILAEKIFESGNIASVFVSQRSITVVQKDIEDWRLMGKRIGQAIREAAATGKPMISDELLKNMPTADSIRARVEEVIEKMINPAVASHGGFIQLMDIKNNDIYIKMGGGCQGCASSQATLKQGVEQTFRREIPDLGAVYDMTNHEEGETPYY